MPVTRRLALAIALATAVFTTLLVTASASPAAAQNMPFACDPGFYQVISGQLKEFNPATGAYVSLGDKQSSYNAAAYRVADGYVYAIRSRSLLRVDSSGYVTDLGQLDFPGGSYTGDFGDDGLLHVSRGGRDWHAIDVDALTATYRPDLDVSTGVADIANVGGKFYGIGATGQLWVMDPAAGTVTAGGAVTGLSGSGSFGAAWSTAGDNLYVGRNVGLIYQISGFTKGSPTATQVATAENTNSNDGASCPDAPAPAGIPDVDGPEPETEASPPQDENPSDATYEFEDAGLGQGATCGTTEDEDRLPRTMVNPLEVTGETVLYSSTYDAPANDYLVLGGSWMVTAGALRQSNTCGYDYTALLKTPQVEDFRFEATLSAVEGINQGGLVFNQSSLDTRSGAMVVDFADGGKTLRWGTYDELGYHVYVGSVPVATTGEVTLGVEVHGRDVEIVLNGEIVANTRADRSGGYVGLITSISAVDFDDVSLVALPAS